MILQHTPRGLPVNVPETDSEDISPKFAAHEMASARAYYEQHGYVVIRGLIEADACDRVRRLWNEEVKPSPKPIYRQATAKLETHRTNGRGWVMNPILNLQSVNPQHFPRFRKASTEDVLANGKLASVFKSILGAPPKIVQSMYFEGNSKTWEHQDSYYLDSQDIGSMCAAWVAIEHIDARAGRFFICPGSHKLTAIKQTAGNNIATGHDKYIEAVVAHIREQKLEIRAPHLNKGDVLLWNSLTIHGSLDSDESGHSRSSITCHAIPANHELLQFHTRRLPCRSTDVRGVQIHRPKDLARWPNRLVFNIEAAIPKLFYSVKKLAIGVTVRLKAAG